MFKRIFLSFISLMIFFAPYYIYGDSTKTLLLIVSESNWEEFVSSPFISNFIPRSSIGSMSIRTNHQNKRIEYYGTINAGRRWNYYELNDMGAVDNGLGDYLNQSGLSTAFFSDKDELIKIIENQYGKTSYKTEDFEELYSDNNKKTLLKSDIILIDMDLYKGEENQEFLIDFIENRPIRLYIFCPYSQDNKLTPFLLYDSKEAYPGLIRSTTTRREGIITNLDIAPSILSYYGIDSSTMVSKGIESYYTKDAYKKIIKDLEKICFLNYYRSDIIKNYIIFLITTLIIYVLLEKIDNKILNRFYDSLTIFALWLPVLFMMTFIRNINFVYGLFIVFFLLIIILLNKFPYEKILKFTALGVFIILVFDSIFNSFLQQNSFLGYDPVIGARFYGIGNEYGGIILGSFYLLIYFISNSSYFMIISLALHFFLAIILGMPFFGANFGATISLFAGMILFCIQYCKNYNIKSLSLLFIIIIVFFIIWIFIDNFLIEEKSHLGQMIFQSTNGNINVFIQVIWRKLIMNLQLIRYSLWSKLLAFSLIIMTIKFDLNNDFLRMLAVPFIGAIIAGIIFNDSGILMGSASSIYFVFPYLRSCSLYNVEK